VAWYISVFRKALTGCGTHLAYFRVGTRVSLAGSKTAWAWSWYVICWYDTYLLQVGFRPVAVVSKLVQK